MNPTHSPSRNGTRTAATVVPPRRRREATAAALLSPESDETRLARAERSLAHLDRVLEFRRVWRQRLKVVSIIAVPLFAALIVRQARVAFA